MERAKKLADLEVAVVTARMHVRRLELGGRYRSINAQDLEGDIADAKEALAAAEGRHRQRERPRVQLLAALGMLNHLLAWW